MKALPYIFLILLIGVAGLFICNQPKKVQAYQYDYFRLHIMANSNETCDQELKYTVKAKLIDFYTPYLSEVKDKEEAIKVVEENLDVANLLINKSLQELGVEYVAKIELKKEYCPSRYYQDYCVEEGVYDSLVVTLGEGKGNNWWCIVYPPLCLVNKFASVEQDIVYQSKILNIIERYFK